MAADGTTWRRAAVPLAAAVFVLAFLASAVAALAAALPVWSAYCLPKGAGALDVVTGISSRDIVSETSSCVWPRASVVWSGADGVLHTSTLTADWRFAAPTVVLVVGIAGLVAAWWRSRTTRVVV